MIEHASIKDARFFCTSGTGNNDFDELVLVQRSSQPDEKEVLCGRINCETKLAGRSFGDAFI